ncbi:MAG: UvrD-helicase domain-containing protein [Clostridia bacterium]|nr:UvrD-helicase domain-containing protein [Clostridia bacterium]
MDFTPAQKTAIAYPPENLLLSAAAGSGKTATLTERILHLLETEQARLSEMLIVTYTRAAAAELRGRIGKKITEAARKSGSRQMARHLTELPGAQISTIHAFLYRTLRPSFAALGLSPDFTIGDEAVIESLRQEAMRDTLDDFYEAGDGDFIRLADTLAGSRDTEALDRTLLGIYKQITAAGETAESLISYGRRLENGGGFFAMPQSAPVRKRLSGALTHYRRTVAALRQDFDERTEKQYGPAAQGILDWLDLLEKALTDSTPGAYGRIRTLLRDYEPVKLGRITAKDATPASEAFKSVRDGLKKDIARYASSFFADPEELAEEALQRTAGLLVTCSRVLSAYEEVFRARKMGRSLLDYNDLEALALRLFLTPGGEPTEAAREAGRQYKYIFIDEYQDTNRVQDSIFRALAENSPRFMVGDSKQSIYRFRGAEPSVFTRYRDHWPVVHPADLPGGVPEEKEVPPSATADERALDPGDILSAEALPGRTTDGAGETPADTSFSPSAGRCLFMSENFRCDRYVVDFVNLVSDFLFAGGSMPYTAEDALVFGKNSGGEIPAEIVLVEKPAAEGDEDTDNPAGDDRDPEAEYAAERIAAMLGTEQIDGRPMTPDDIAILLRSPETSGDAFRQALVRRGIPVRMPGGEYLFGSPAVLLVMCLLHTADNPLFDIPAAGAMHSPLFGFATHELVLLRDWSRRQLAGRYRWEGDMPLYYIVKMAADPDWSFLPATADEPAAEPAETDPRTQLTFGEPDEPAPFQDTDSTVQPVLRETDVPAGLRDTVSPAQPALPEASANPWEEPAEMADAFVGENLPEELTEKCRRFRDAADELREMAHGMRTDRFLDELYRRFALFDLPEVRENPVEKANLQALYDMARRYESGSFGGVGGFLAYTEELQDQKQQSGEDSLPAVTILSIHKSKGLEYPVVFVSACARRRNNRDELGDILFDTDLGFGMRLPDTGGYARCGTALRSAIGEKKRMESVEEEMRVVYVALTRARNRLIVTGKVKNAEDFVEDCRLTAAYATPYSITGNHTCLEWILSAALAHGPDPCWKLLTASPLAETETAEDALPDEPEAAADWDGLLAENMDFVYPYAYLAKVPAKLTVSKLSPGILDEDGTELRFTLDETEPHGTEPHSSELSADALPENVLPERGFSAGEEAPMPSFMTGAPAHMTAAQRGTATHMFLQFADFAALAENGVEAELARLTEHHFLEEKTAAGVYVTQLERFRQSDLFRRICTSPLCHREFRFNAPMDTCRFTEDPVLAEALRRDGIRLIVQGVVDCVFRDEDGALTLVDYKTDRPLAAEYKNPPLADERFIARHGKQLSYYREICGEMFGEEIRRTVIYSTALAREIAVP